MTTWSIGEAAAKCGLSQHTLRWYERIGLLASMLPLLVFEVPFQRRGNELLELGLVLDTEVAQEFGGQLRRLNRDRLREPGCL